MKHTKIIKIIQIVFIEMIKVAIDKFLMLVTLLGNHLLVHLLERDRKIEREKFGTFITV